MRSLLFIIAIILLIGWAAGTFIYAVGSLIHILLILAVIAFIFALIRRV